MSESEIQFKIALIQLKNSKNKIENVEKAISLIRKASEIHKANVICLPELFNSYFHPECIKSHAESIPDGYTSKSLSKIAQACNAYIIGGSIPEIDNEKLYNTCTIWDPKGQLIGKYRKVHLFDIDVKNGTSVKESNTFAPGINYKIVEIFGHKIGIQICYDIRFQEMSIVYRKEGCEMIICPAAFAMTTGPMHWELLTRGRANDNQIYVATISPARNEDSKYVCFGHSMIADPWGRVIEEAGEYEEIICTEIDFGKIKELREQIPILSQLRNDLYRTERVIDRKSDR